MAQGNKGGSNGKTNGNTGGSNGRAGSPGNGRAPNGFAGGNWPSTVTGVGSGGNRGNAPTKR